MIRKLLCPLALGGRRERDPGNEVDKASCVSWVYVIGSLKKKIKKINNNNKKKSEVGIRKSEVGSRKSEVESPSSAFV